MPALGRQFDRARGPEPRLGTRQQAARLPDAASGHPADPVSDRFVDVKYVLVIRGLAAFAEASAAEPASGPGEVLVETGPGLPSNFQKILSKRMDYPVEPGHDGLSYLN